MSLGVCPEAVCPRGMSQGSDLGCMSRGSMSSGICLEAECPRVYVLRQCVLGPGGV